MEFGQNKIAFLSPCDIAQWTRSKIQFRARKNLFSCKFNATAVLFFKGTYHVKKKKGRSVRRDLVPSPVTQFFTEHPYSHPRRHSPTEVLLVTGQVGPETMC